MSVIVVATVTPVHEHRGEVISALEEAIASVHATDEGCELYALHEGEDRLVMIEKWTSSDALEVHNAGAALAELTKRISDKLAGAPEIQILTPHPAGTAEQGSV